MAHLVKTNCPNCHAAVKVDPHANRATCEYCGTESVVLHKKSQDRKPTGMPVMLLPPEERARNRKIIIAIVVVVIIAATSPLWGLMACGALSGIFVLAMDNATPTDPVDQTDSVGEITLADVHDPNNPPARSEFSIIDGCICRSNIDGVEGIESMQLVAKVMSWDRVSTPSGVKDRFVTRYYIDISGQRPWYLPINEQTSPSIYATKSFRTFYIACIDNIVAIASDSIITGWDIRQRRELWSTPLGGDYSADGYTPPEARPGVFSHRCTSLNDNLEVLTIPIDNGPINVNTRNGSVVP